MIKYIYCPVCKTISAVSLGHGFILPKMCKCMAEEKGEEWIADDELIKALEGGKDENKRNY